MATSQKMILEARRHLHSDAHLTIGILRDTMDSMKSKRRESKPMPGHLVVRIPDALRAALEKAAAQDRRKLSDWVRITLEDALGARKRRR